MKMNKMLSFLVGFLFLGFSGSLFAEPKISQAGQTMPNAGQFVSEAVYRSSTSCESGAALLISTRAAFLFALNITSAGSANANMIIWDASRATNTAVNMIAQYIDTSAEDQWVFNVGASSGIILSNNGTTPACFSCLYYER